MAIRTKTIDLLPEIFRTTTNEKFLNATLEQLVQPSQLKRVEGYIGLKTGLGVSAADAYVREPDTTRQNYQLEPTVCYKKTNTNETEDLITYPGMVDALKTHSANTNKHNRLFTSEYYSWDPLIDYDKFINFSQYYWTPAGADSVDIKLTDLVSQDAYTITRGTDGYTFDTIKGDNPTVSLMRGGNYTFTVNQTGNPFYIQTDSGTSGTVPGQPNQSSREVFGVENNGDDNGVITFKVPDADAQNQFLTMTKTDDVDLVTDLRFDQINNRYVKTAEGTTNEDFRFLTSFDEDVVTFDGKVMNGFGVTPFDSAIDIAQDIEIDGVKDLDGKTIIFTNQNPGDGAESGWRTQEQFDGVTYDNDDAVWDKEVEITLQSQRYSIWKIKYLSDDSTDNQFISLSRIQEVPNNTKVYIKSGTTFNNEHFYKDAEGFFQQQPLITATSDTLYYQDGTDATKFGVIRLVEGDAAQTLDVTADILGKIQYTSPTGVKLNNGLKIIFRGPTEPTSYQDNEFYVEGCGSSIKLLALTDFQTPEAFTISESKPFDDVGFDSVAYDSSLNAPTALDYFTINRASPDQNPWSRSNRWVHIDIINQSAEINNVPAVLNQANRAKRPVIEFKSGLRLYDFGTSGIAPVDIIDTAQVDALSNVHGSLGYTVDGFKLLDGSRIIFTNDDDTTVKNKVYKVEIIDPVGISMDPGQTSVPIINLVLESDLINTDTSVYCKSGVTLQGKSFRYNGTDWIQGQQKTAVNQQPLFDIFDSAGKSLSDVTAYPSSSFVGTKLFSYSPGTGNIDSILGLRLKYESVSNVGDIVFDNNFYKDTFISTVDVTSSTKNIAIGFARQYTDKTTYSDLSGWQKAKTNSKQPQVFTFKIDGTTLTTTSTLKCDIKYDATDDNAVYVDVNNKFKDSSTYTITSTIGTTITSSTGTRTTNGTTSITFASALTKNDIVQVFINSKEVSKEGAYYQVPLNLANNAVNKSFDTITLGAIRNHFVGMAQRTPKLSGTILGSNNIRNLGNYESYGVQIVEHSAPMQFMATFCKDSNINFFDALDFSRNEYEKFKKRLLDAISTKEYTGDTTAKQLDGALNDINRGMNPDSPFYWTDTLPMGEVFTETKYTITPTDDDIFDTVQTYDFTKANFLALSIYVNDILLVKDTDYTVATDGPRVIILKILSSGDVLKIREYGNTAGNFLPATPTKLGLYDSYLPEIVTDTTYTTAHTVIVGHDGSRTMSYGDSRDDILLEFEKRIYNNLKVNIAPPMHWYDVIPGKFRTTDYTTEECINLLAPSFLDWVSQNRIDFKAQTYSASEKKTWNYSSATNRVDDSLLLGHTRGNHILFYDTDDPGSRPWEMLGFTKKPVWWENAYGPAPYTSDNEILWGDLALGKVVDPAGVYYLTDFVRPGLETIKPTDDEGATKSIFDVLVKNYDELSLKKSWDAGDVGPAENAWRKSSSWAFAIQKLLAQTQPAKYFTLNVDIDRYRYSTSVGHYLYDSRDRLTTSIELCGEDTPKHSYINWIDGHSRVQGISSNTHIKNLLSNSTIQLSYRTASYTDKQYLKVFTEKTSTNSLNTSLLLPDESYEILTYNNEIFDTVAYSSVIVQKVEGGFSIFGLGKTNQYFTIFESIPNGNVTSFNVGSTQVSLSKDFSTTEKLVPYGYTFTNVGTACDFLNSYGKWLESKGFIFDDRENEYFLNWSQMINELLYWSQQGWIDGSIINLNPNANKLKIERTNAIVAPILGQTANDFVLNQNKVKINNEDLIWDRIDNKFTITSTNEDAISFIELKFTSYEHVLLFDNTSVFNDLLYNPSTGQRQARLKLVGYNTDSWDGTLNSPGLFRNDSSTVNEWASNIKYYKGEIVLRKSKFYSAVEPVPPSEKFDVTKWVETEYDQIKKGMIPNIYLKNNESEGFYNKTLANLESDADQLGFGLVGFKTRDYMEGLNLNDISQMGIYSNFIGTKGTTQALDIFKNSKLSKELSDYTIHENWAIKLGNYGASENRSYFEVKLNASSSTGNPSTIKIIEDLDNATADQNTFITDIYKSSYNITTTAILPTTDFINNDQSLPDAGFVHFDDVEVKSFNLDDFSEIVNKLDIITEGSKIWIAKDNRYTWNVYRASLQEAELIAMVDNLDETTTFTFDGKHELVKNDIFIIKHFKTELDGAFKVASVNNLSQITVNFSFPEGLNNTLTQTDIGIVFILKTAKVTQASDVADLSYVTELVTGEKIWVQEYNSGQWATLEKIQPFTSANTTNIDPYSAVANGKFGSSVSQSKNGKVALIGSPDAGTGVVDVYVEGDTATTLSHSENLTCGATGISGFGTVVRSSNNKWHITGARLSQSEEGFAVIIRQLPNSEVFQDYQLLTVPTGRSSSTMSDFGYSVAISQNSRVIWVGAPGIDKVYGYQLNEYEDQLQRFTGDGSTREFDITGLVDVDSTDELSVVVNNVIQTLTTQWSYSTALKTITFVTAPAAGLPIKIKRLSTSTITTFDGSSVDFSLATLKQATSIEAFQVRLDDVLQRPHYDYTYDSGTKVITFTTAPASSAVASINSTDYFSLFATISNPTSDPMRFGHSLATTTDGRQVTIGALEGAGGDSALGVGEIYVYDRDCQRFHLTKTVDYGDSGLDTVTYTTTSAITGVPTVLLNEKILEDDNVVNSGGYTYSGSTVTFKTASGIKIGDFIDIETNNMSLVEILSSSAVVGDAEFGYDVKICSYNCSIYAGCPGDTKSNTEGIIKDDAGSVARFINKSRVYGLITGTVENPTVTIGQRIRINDFYVTFTGTSLDNVVTDINNANIPNVTASNSSNKLHLTLDSLVTTALNNKLIVWPVTGNESVLTDLGLTIFSFMQTMYNPFPRQFARFGHSLDVSSNALGIAVGAPGGATNLIVTFDIATMGATLQTKFDAGATVIKDIQTASGAVYTFDYLKSTTDTFINPGKFVYGQQITDTKVTALNDYGKSVDYVSGKLLVGSPGYDTTTLTDSGRIVRFYDTEYRSSWSVKREQTKTVNTALLDSSFLYDISDNDILTYLDYIDPLQGKILGVARENIDIITPEDPAGYSEGSINTYGDVWGQEHVGRIWWDVTNTRFLNYNQDTEDYKAKRLGQLFTGSTADIYQWVSSDVQPEDYEETGTPYNTTSYTQLSDVIENGSIKTKFYFWVKDLEVADTFHGKTLSPVVIAQYIENPKSSGIPYIGAIASNAFAIYNSQSLISSNDSVVHIEFDRENTENNIHAEYELIKDSDPAEFLSDRVYRKLQDSFCGVDSAGNIVPDITLSDQDKVGVQFRPRQSMFKDRFSALKNYITRANSNLAIYPITEMKTFKLLDSEENEPSITSNTWDTKVATEIELEYQQFELVSAGHRYLVEADGSNGGLWAIYTLQSDKTTTLVTRIQNYKTPNYWEYTHWWAIGYNKNINPVREVATVSALETVTDVPAGTIVKVTANAQNKWERHELKPNGTWERVGLQTGTIKIKSTLHDYSVSNNGFSREVFDAQYFDEEPVLETRQIIKAINEELFVDDLASHRIEGIKLIFEYIFSEQETSDFLMKTSLIDVEHTVRELKTFTNLQNDNQTFIESYLSEVKPYRTQIKEFNLKYTGVDTANSDTSDFDLPSQYNTSLAKYVSPQHKLGGVRGSGEYYDLDDAIWLTQPYKDWKNNFTLSIDSITVISGGSGYTSKPIVTITGDCTTQATMVAVINTAGAVTAITITNSGVGYTSTPVITISQGGGTGATAIAVCSPGSVRSYKTSIKFDRYEYSSSIVDWAASTVYTLDQLVRYNNKVYKASTGDGSTLSEATFNPLNYTLVDASELTGIERTAGLYAPTSDMPGIDLGLLISGIDYPGVKVTSPTFSQNTGFNVGNFDINPYDNLDFGPEGKPTYSDVILDTIYQSSAFTNSYLGTLSTDINVGGGVFIDTYSSHAPEEFLPGAIFDTLNLTVLTRPGADYLNKGLCFTEKTSFFQWDGLTMIHSFSTLLDDPFELRVFNLTTGKSLRFNNVGETATVDFTVDWLGKTITLVSSATDFRASTNDVIGITAYGIGGGNQLWQQSYSPADYIQDNNEVHIIVPVKHEEIRDVVIYINGKRITSNYSIDNYDSASTWDNSTYGFETKILIKKEQAVTATDYIAIDVLGFEDNEQDSALTIYYEFNASLSIMHNNPITQNISTDNSSYDYALTNDLSGSNSDLAIVELNGLRLRPPEGFEFDSDGSTTIYTLFQTTDTSVSSIADNELAVYKDDIKLTLGADYTFTTTDGSSSRSVILATPPYPEEKIKIFIRTDAEYTIDPSTNILTIKSTVSLPADNHISVTTFNQTGRLDGVTKVYDGQSIVTVETPSGFDMVGFDETATPFDKVVTTQVLVSEYELGRDITKPEKLIVHVNGQRKFYGSDFKLKDGDISKIEFTSLSISATDYISVTLTSENLVPARLEYNIFHDMKGNKAIYRQLETKTTELTSPLGKEDLFIYVNDASVLGAPDLTNNVFGIIIIDEERITYRTRDITNNKLGGLRRGTAGTSLSTHATATKVYNKSIGEYLDWPYTTFLYKSTDGVDDGSTIIQEDPLQKTDSIPAKFLRNE